MIRISNSTPIILVFFLMPFLSRNAVAALVACLLLISLPVISGNLKKIDRPCIVSLIALFLCYPLSLLFSINLAVAIRECLIALFACAWALCVTCYCLSERINIQRLLRTYCSSCCLISILYLLAHFTNASWLSFVLRIELLLDDNHFSHYVGGAIVVGIVLFYYNRKLSTLLMCVICSAAFALGTSRGSLVAIVVALSIMVLIMSKSNRFIKVILFLSVFGTGLYLAFFLDSIDKLTFLRIFDPNSSFSNRERFAMWTSSLKMFFHNPLGIGAANWAMAYNGSIYQNIIHNYSHPHSVFIAVLCELGLQGFTAFCGVIVCGVRRVLGNVHQFGFNPVNVSLLLYAAYSVVSFLLNNPMNNNKPFMLFYAFIGMCFAVKQAQSPPEYYEIKGNYSKKGRYLI